MIDWTDISNEEIRGTFSGQDEVVFRIKREKQHPYFWNMVGLLDGRNQYRNDLKSQAEQYVKSL